MERRSGWRQRQILAHLHEHGPTWVRDLAGLPGLTDGWVHFLLRDMEVLGLVQTDAGWVRLTSDAWICPTCGALLADEAATVPPE